MHTGRPMPAQVVFGQHTAPGALQGWPSGTHWAGAWPALVAAGAWGRTSTVSARVTSVAQPASSAAAQAARPRTQVSRRAAWAGDGTFTQASSHDRRAQRSCPQVGMASVARPGHASPATAADPPRGTGSGGGALNLDPAVGRARAGRHRPRWQGANRSNGPCHCEDLQRRQRGRGRPDRVRSALTRQVTCVVAALVAHIKHLHAEESGQLPDLG
jgi:hypothetical protein